MKTAGIRRTLIAGMLLGCILFSLFACGLHHAQMTARGLLTVAEAPAQAGHQSHNPHAPHDAHGPVATPVAPAQDDSPGHDGHQLAAAFSCPLCSSFGGVVAIHSAGWSVPPALQASGVTPALSANAAPPRRQPWSALNPRAPPAGFLRS